MRALGALATLLLLGGAPAPGADATVLRATLALADADGDWAYCVVRALDEAPFAGIRRDLAFEDSVQAIPPAASAPRTTPADRLAAIRERVATDWLDDKDAPLAPDLLERLIAAAVAIAERGDPTPLPPGDDAVAELNAMDNAAVPVEPAPPELEARLAALESQADRIAARADAPPADHGRIDRGWLAPGQRTADACPNPSLSLSSVARAGDLAFIDVGRVWGPLAGIGETWVMERATDGWRRVARRRTWIS